MPVTGRNFASGPDRAPQSKRRSRLVVILLIAIAALWPSVLNGGPFYHPDTPTYFRAAAAGSYKTVGLETAWTEKFLRVYVQPSQDATGPQDVSKASSEGPITLKGRSIYYGVFLYLSYLFGSLWIVAAVQSLIAATSIYLTVRSIGRAQGTAIPQGRVLLIGLIAPLATSLGFFSAYLMPDIFTGLGVLAVANLLFFWNFQSRVEKTFWISLLAYAMLVHSTNLVLSAGLIPVSIAYALWQRIPISGAQLASIGCCIAGGLLGQAAYSMAVKAGTGESPVRIPFIAMRLIADGPGYDYLKAHCATERYVYCRVLDQKNTQSDVLLWSSDPQISLFRGLDADDQRTSAAQQTQFVIAVLKEKPLPVITTAARNSVGQLLNMDLSNFNYSAVNRQRYESNVPSGAYASMKLSRAYKGSMPTLFIESAMAVLCVLSLLFLVGFLVSSRNLNAGPRVRAYCVCILAGIAINAVICGALSGPKGRYESRLIWILPIIAAAVAASSGMPMLAPNRDT